MNVFAQQPLVVHEEVVYEINLVPILIGIVVALAAAVLVVVLIANIRRRK